MAKQPESPNSVVRHPEPAKDRGELITTLRHQEISPSTEQVTSINGHDVIGSYRQSRSQPEVIYVPGEAPVLNPNIETPMKLPPVDGAFKHPGHRDSCEDFCLETAIRAAIALDDNLNFSDIDMLISARTMRSLFGFGHRLLPRICDLRLFLQGKILIVESYERGGAEEWSHHNTGCSQEDARDCKNNFRMIKYDLDSLRCAVHVKVDVRLPFTHPEPAAVSTKWLPSHKNDGPGTNLIYKGSAKPEDSLARVTVRSLSRHSTRAYSMCKLWCGREDYLVGGSHDNGTITNKWRQRLRDRRLLWEGQQVQQESLRKLVTLLHKLREIVQSTEKKRAIVHWSWIAHPGEIRVYHYTSDEKLLPDQLVERCWTKLENDAEPQEDHLSLEEHALSSAEAPTSFEIVELCWKEAENRARIKRGRSKTWPKPYVRRSVYPA